MRDERRYGMQDTPDRIAELEAKVARLEAEVKLQSDSADHWEDEAMKHMSRAAELQATLERLEDIARMENGMRERADATIEEAMKLKQMVLDDMSPPALRIQARKI